MVSSMQNLIVRPSLCRKHLLNCSCERAKMPKIDTCVLSLCLEDPVATLVPMALHSEGALNRHVSNHPTTVLLTV